MRRALIAALPAAASLGAASGLGAQTVGPAAPAPTTRIRASLAPRGRLRAAINVGNVVVAPRDPASGAPRGVSVDIANELGRRLGVPVEQVVYPAASAVVTNQVADDWDVAFLGAEPERAAVIAFTAPYVFVEGTYLVRAASPYRSVAELDRPGIRIATGQGSAYDLYLTRTLKQAGFVRAPSSAAAIAVFLEENLDAAAGVRQALVEAQAATPGLRVLDDSFMRIEQAVAAPQGRTEGFRWLAAVIEELKASGFIRSSLDRSGQTGAVVAPPA
jgi:polar amino acid transport system substrate-binding protein